MHVNGAKNAMTRDKTRSGHAVDKLPTQDKQGQITLDLSRGSLPIIIVFGLLIGSVSVAYTVGNLIAGYRYDRGATDSRFIAIEKQLLEIKTLLSGRLDDASWCAQTEAQNRGWKCPKAR